jgi:hypothetical protein
MFIVSILKEIFNTFVEMAPYLLLGLTFAGFLHILFSREFVMKHLGGAGIASTVKAALLGVPLPLCSCGVLPTALSLRKNRASEGATMSFLISTPQTGVDSIVATWGMLGPVFAVFRPLMAFVMGIAGGIIVNFLEKGDGSSEKGGATDRECPMCYRTGPHTHPAGEKFMAMAKYAYSEFLDDISSHLIVGIVISGLIAFFLPPDIFSRYMGNDFLEMLVMIAGGIPLYVCATSSIPIAMALMMKGLSPGAAFVFLAVGPATNAASIMLITSTLGKRFSAIYLGSISVLSIAAGYALNAVFTISGSQLSHVHALHDHAAEMKPWPLFFSLVFGVLLGASLYRKYVSVPVRRLLAGAAEKHASGETQREFVFRVNGMSCARCVRTITGSVLALGGVGHVDVDVAKKTVTVRASGGEQKIRDAISRAGYEVMN